MIYNHIFSQNLLIFISRNWYWTKYLPEVKNVKDVKEVLWVILFIGFLLAEKIFYFCQCFLQYCCLICITILTIIFTHSSGIGYLKNKRLLQEKQEYFYSKENSVTAPPQAAYFTAGGIIGSLLGTIIEAVMRGIL